MRLNAKDVLQATEGDLIGTATATADSYAIDTRRLAAGGCFVALQGDRDGNDFVADAWARGATIAIVTRPPDDVPEGCAVIHVHDSLAALGSLGRLARS
jgi:UDP-N-acetylmuramoyl-tripeptide--D-alanyl-D-alanine ligase